MLKAIIQSLLIILSFVFVFIWQHSPLSTYTIPTLGFFILLYSFIAATISLRKKQFMLIPDSDNPFNIFVLAIVVILLVISGGGLHSNFFYLLYFLAFGISVVFHPKVVFVYMLATIIFFTPDALTNDSVSRFTQLGLLFIITPLAYFFGKEMHAIHSDVPPQTSSATNKAQEKTKTLSLKEIEELLEKKGTTRKETD